MAEERFERFDLSPAHDGGGVSKFEGAGDSLEEECVLDEGLGLELEDDGAGEDEGTGESTEPPSEMSLGPGTVNLLKPSLQISGHLKSL